jgi:hypothetical protein
MLILLATFAFACDDPSAPRLGAPVSAALGQAGAQNGEGDEHSGRAHLDLRKERASLTAANQALSDEIAEQGIVAGLGGAFATSVILLVPREPLILGGTAARNFLTTSAAPTAMRWETLRADVSSDGTQGYTLSQGFLRVKLGGGPSEFSALFLAYWRRDRGGAWTIASFVFNARSPNAQTVPDGFGTPATKHRRHFPNTSVTEERAALLAVDAAFAAKSVSDGAGPAFAAFAAPTAVAVAAGELVFGPSAIGTAFTLKPGDVLRWVPLYSDAAATGDLGFTAGEATFQLNSIGQTSYSKYLTIWQKQNTGEWEYVADLGNSRPAS